MTDTIFAVSSGLPPAAIGIIRVSGPQAGMALQIVSGSLPPPRRASLRSLRAKDGSVIDRALVLWVPGPDTATGEDVAEFHCHGGKAVLSALEQRLDTLDGLRQAEPGEFTRRAFSNGVIDLAQAEGLGDLLAAETELQRRAAQEAVSGSLSARIEEWRGQVIALSSQVEAVLDFDDEDDVTDLPSSFDAGLNDLITQWRDILAAPRAERLRDGVRVVLAGPPNSGKSSLFNVLLDEGASIVSPEAGTTRDFIERPVSVGGIPFVFIDTAGLRESGAGAIEQIGISRAQGEIEKADIVLWLGPEGDGPDRCWEIESFSDRSDRRKSASRHLVSAETGSGVGELVSDLVTTARSIIPKPNSLALNKRQHAALGSAMDALLDRHSSEPPLVTAERLRFAREALDRLSGRKSTEDMLDSLFSRFCIGK